MPEIGDFPAEINKLNLHKQPLEATHNPKVVGSNPAPATTYFRHFRGFRRCFFLALKHPLGHYGDTAGIKWGLAFYYVSEQGFTFSCSFLLSGKVIRQYFSSVSRLPRCLRNDFYPFSYSAEAVPCSRRRGIRLPRSCGRKCSGWSMAKRVRGVGKC